MIPISIFLWGVACAAQTGMSGRNSFFALRGIVGFLQGGFIPEMILYLSYYYKSNELPIRLSIFWTGIPVTQIIGSLLAAGLLKMRGIRGLGGWQWLYGTTWFPRIRTHYTNHSSSFLVEGLMCIVVGIISALIMPASVTEGAILFRRKDGTNAWWTEDEEKILVNRILRDDPTKGDMNNRQAVSLKGIWKAVVNIDLWPIYLVRKLQGVLAWIAMA